MVIVAPLVAVAVLAVASILGLWLLRATRLDVLPFADRALLATGLGLYVIALAVFCLGMGGVLHRWTMIALLSAALAVAWRDARDLLRRMACAMQRPPLDRIFTVQLALGVLIMLATVVNATSSLAPLTGSDPIQYHFTFPKLFLRAGRIEPIWWDVNSFYLGTPHMIILLGMALGDDRVALALSFAVAVLTGVALFRLAGAFLPKPYPTVAVAVFSVTPVVYWEATSGYIDLWTALYATLAVSGVVAWLRQADVRWVFLSGLSAGFAASCKYTLWVAPILLGVLLAGVVLLGGRRWREAVGIAAKFCSAALVAGLWPNVRNLIWTGDPFFPFLTSVLRGADYNAMTSAKMWGMATGRAADLSVAAILLYPLRAVLGGEDFTGGRFLGPIVLSFLPVSVLLMVRADHSRRVVGGLTAGFFFFVAVTSQRGRYLVPVYPAALVLSLEAMARVRNLRWAQAAGVTAIAVFLVFGLVSNLVYAVSFFPVVIGIEPEERFLKRKAPQYESTKFINEVVPREERALVFLHHMYYLEGTYLFGGPEFSWEIDYGRMNSVWELKEELERLGIRYIVKHERYPAEVAPLFEALEGCCLQAVAHREVVDLVWRRFDERKAVGVTIYRLLSEGGQGIGGSASPGVGGNWE